MLTNHSRREMMWNITGNNKLKKEKTMQQCCNKSDSKSAGIAIESGSFILNWKLLGAFALWFHMGV